MESKKLPTINIKGQEYTLVKDRILEFNRLYPAGSIETKLLTPPEADKIVVVAVVRPDPGRSFTGHSQAVVGDGYINKTSALENCETSAVGRALAMLGIGVIDSVASVDEINKAETTIPADPRKIKIKKLCDNINPLLTSKEAYENFVLDKTLLPLAPDNYDLIIEALTPGKFEPPEEVWTDLPPKEEKNEIMEKVKARGWDKPIKGK